MNNKYILIPFICGLLHSTIQKICSPGKKDSIFVMINTIFLLFVKFIDVHSVIFVPHTTHCGGHRNTVQGTRQQESRATKSLSRLSFLYARSSKAKSSRPVVHDTRFQLLQSSAIFNISQVDETAIFHLKVKKFKDINNLFSLEKTLKH